MYTEILLSAVLLIILCYKQKKVFVGENDYLSLSNTNQIKGFFALVILGHHLVQTINANSSYLGLKNFGYLAVAVFFFFNGYGLMFKFHSNKNYLTGFFKNRVLKITVPFLFVYMLYIILDIFEGKSYTVIYVLKSFINGCPIAGNLWYVIFIILFYIVFWIFAKMLGKNNEMLIGAITIFLGLWCGFCLWRKFSYVWFVSCFSILLGMIWEPYRRIFDNWFKKHYYISVILSFLLFASCHFGYTLNIETMKGFALEIVSSLAFTIFVVLFNIKLQNNNKILQFAGKISFELYMLHGLFITLLRGNHLFIINDLLFIVLVIGCSIISASIMNKIISNISIKRKSAVIKST